MNTKLYNLFKKLNVIYHTKLYFDSISIITEKRNEPAILIICDKFIIDVKHYTGFLYKYTIKEKTN